MASLFCYLCIYWVLNHQTTFTVRLTIFENIIFRSLRPWKQENLNERDYLTYLKVKGFTNQQLSIDEFKVAVETIFPKDKYTQDKDFELYELDQSPDTINIVSPLINIKLPKAENSKCRFYYYLITNEVTRLTNLLYRFYKGPSSTTDKTYIINNVLEQVKYLIRESTNELQQGDHNEDSKYILQALRLSLVRFLYELEHLFSDIIKTPSTTNDELHFDLLKEEVPDECVYNLTDTLISLVYGEPLNETKTNQTQQPSRVSFGFKGDKDKLLEVIKVLTHEIELLNIDLTTPKQLVDVLTSKNLSQDLPKIYFGVETKQVRYVFDKLMPFCSNLKKTLIAKCNLFYSKLGTPLTFSNLTSSKDQNPKNKELIDEIFRSL